jgi:hypothetical protein
MHSADVLYPTWDQVEEAIRALDEQTYNDLYLCPIASNPETYLLPRHEYCSLMP